MTTKNSSAFKGSSMNIKSTPGIAPINGPNIGMIFVIPTTVYTKTAQGILNINIKINVNTPIIKESKILPTKKFVVDLSNIIATLQMKSTFSLLSI